MRIIITDNYEQMSDAAAKIVAEQIHQKPYSVLGLSTGSTPLLMYQKLIEIHKTVGLDFSRAISFNLDEYVGLSADNPNSYHNFMHVNFFDHINIDPKNIHIPDGTNEDLLGECTRYERMITEAGGIDLQILGIGQNAHIGFNEPDVKFESTTHTVILDDDTIKANARFFSREEDVPRYAVSMGIKTIMLAKRVVLLAHGGNKANAVRRAICGRITPETPASILQLHQDATFIIDKDAAAKLPLNTAEKNIENP